MKHGLFAELKRRHVYRVAVAYAVVGWLVIEIATQVFPTFHMPDWAPQLVIFLIVLGFPVTLVMAWAFEMTPEGVRRTQPADSPEARAPDQHRKVGRTLDYVIISVLAVALVLALWRPWPAHHASPAGKRSLAAASSLAAGSMAPAGVSASKTAAAASSSIPARSIAVLPFANDSNDKNQRYFSDGLAENLIIALSQYPALTVIGRDSSFQMRNTRLDSRQIGRKLEVANLLEGSVSRAGGEVRIRAELVSTKNGRTLWSDFYDRPYKNLFALQDDITKAVAQALKAKLLDSTRSRATVQSDRPPSGNLDAYNAYLKGNFYVNQLTQKGLHKAIASYRKAVRIDPRYDAAYARLSFVWSRLAGGPLAGEARRTALANARAASQTAIRLNPDSSAAYVAQGSLLLTMLRWHGAEAAFRHALTLEPANLRARASLAAIMSALGRIDEAVNLMDVVIKTNPLDARAYLDQSLYLAGAGRLKAAATAVRHAISLEPEASELHAWLAAIEVLRGHPKKALREAKSEPSAPWRIYALTLAYQGMGDKALADKALHESIAMAADYGAYQIAETYAFRGEPDQAFAWLDRAWRQHDSGISELLDDPFLLRYKHDPRFAAFCRKVGLPTPEEVAAGKGRAGN